MSLPINRAITSENRLQSVPLAGVSEKFPILTYRDIRVVTTETLAQGYGTDEGNIRQNLSRNLHRFEEGTHYFLLTGQELKQFKNRVTESNSVGSNARSLTLWTEKGAARMSKIVDTNQAWDFFEKLEDSYFNLREVHGVMLPNIDDPIQLARAWADAMEAKQQAEQLTHRQAEYIEHLEELFAEGLSPVQFCKRLNGVNSTKISSYLQSSNWLYDDNSNGSHAQWRVRSAVRDKYLTEKSSTITPKSTASFTTYQPILLRSGAVWLYRKYLKGQLPMKVTWDGEFTHDRYLAGEA